jgi:hypothetical protein
MLAVDSNLIPNLVAHPCIDIDTMTNMASCSFTSISDLLDKADTNLLSITTMITSCPDICSLAWGEGNPDLSGIGVNISYKVQAALTPLCGPITCLVYALRHRFKSGLSKRTETRLSEIHNCFIVTSVGFNLPVAIATVIRISEYPPIFELFYLVDLLNM